MGLTYLEVEVGNPANPDITERIEFLVDSGAIYSVVPEPVLAKLRDQAAHHRRVYSGRRYQDRRKKGGALFRYEEKVGVAEVISRRNRRRQSPRRVHS